LVVEGASVIIDHLTFTGSGDGTALEVRESGDLRVESSTVIDVSEGVLVRNARAVVVGSEVRESGLAAIRFTELSTGSVEYTLLRNNTTGVAASGGSSVDVDHVTIHGADAGVDATGGVPGIVTLQNSIVWQTNDAIREANDSPVEVAFSDLSGVGVREGEGNINADPLFVAAAVGDFRITYLSPCRGAGAEASDMGAFPYVLDGDTGRFLRCDANGDGINDLSDAVFTLLQLFAGGSAPVCPPASDCNGDSIVDLADSVFDLNFLFLAGPPPQAPYPACEVAPIAVCPGDICRDPP
jgi:hypothetical protein